MVAAASEVLKKQGYVSAIDVLLGMGWLTPDRVEAWRRGEAPYLEQLVHAGLGKIGATLRAFHRWAAAQGLRPSRTEYVASKSRRPLQFSRSGEHTLEERYRTHWVSRRLRLEKEQKTGARSERAVRGGRPTEPRTQDDGEIPF